MTQSSKLQNTICCTLAALVASCTTLRASIKYLSGVIPFKAQIALILLGVLATIFYAIIKNKKASQDANRGEFFAFWHSVLRYFLALDMVSIGLQKIFHLQFVIPLALLDTPFSEMKGDDLIWAFFGKYYSFTVIIAALQICGAVLLLFRRTWLVGVMILLPLMLNIVLLDWYYWITLVVNIYSTILTAGVVYLLFTEYDSLVQLFFKAKCSLPKLNFKSNLNKNLIRASAVIIPILLIASYKFPETHPEIFGKYEVKKMMINDSLQTIQPCRDSVLTKVFIDQGDFVMEFNNHKRLIIGSYKYIPATQSITVNWRYPANHPDSLVAKISSGENPGQKILVGRMGRKILGLKWSGWVRGIDGYSVVVPRFTKFLKLRRSFCI